jgi:HD-like signal output (HDOD) protein
MSEAEKSARIISRLGDLPAMPDVVSNVLTITDNPNMAMEDVSRAIEADPGMTAKVLRVSNSSYYGMKQHVGTLKLALVILGTREVRNIVLGISVFDSFKDSGVSESVIQDIWNRSLRVAALAKQMAILLGLRFEGEEFIAGLLADIGKIVFFRKAGKAYWELLRNADNDWRALAKMERETFECAHPFVAMALADRWNLPASLVDALRLQLPHEEESLEDAAAPELAALTRIAKLAALDDFDAEDGTPCSIVEEEAWRLLEKAPHPVSSEGRRELLQTCIHSLSSASTVSL